LLAVQLPKGLNARQLAEDLGKNYNTTRSLLRKMEKADEILHINSQYFAKGGNESLNAR
jgi:hypothetical protein